MSTSPSLSLPPAGFWLRLAAAFLDLLVLLVPLAVFVSFLSVALHVSNEFLGLHPGQAPAEIRRLFGPHFVAWSMAFFAVSSALYFSLFESSRWRATLGKRAFSLYVADSSGAPVSFLQALARFGFGRFLFHVPVVGFYYLCADLLAIPFTSKKQSLHDLIARTLVLRESALTPFRP